MRENKSLIDCVRPISGTANGLINNEKKKILHIPKRMRVELRGAVLLGSLLLFLESLPFCVRFYSLMCSIVETQPVACNLRWKKDSAKYS